MIFAVLDHGRPYDRVAERESYDFEGRILKTNAPD